MAARSAEINVMVTCATKVARALTRDFGEIEQLQTSRAGSMEFTKRSFDHGVWTLNENLTKARPERNVLVTSNDSPELPEDFAYFPHVNPQAPKGGSITHTAVGGSFDSTNPFIIRGTPATGISQIYDTLMASNPNEPFSLYGLLAKGVRLDPERRRDLAPTERSGPPPAARRSRR